MLYLALPWSRDRVRRVSQGVPSLPASERAPGCSQPLPREMGDGHFCFPVHFAPLSFSSSVGYWEWALSRSKWSDANSWDQWCKSQGFTSAIAFRTWYIYFGNASAEPSGTGVWSDRKMKSVQRVPGSGYMYFMVFLIWHCCALVLL